MLGNIKRFIIFVAVMNNATEKYLVTKAVHQYTYYLKNTEFKNNKWYYEWTGLTHNALEFSHSEAVSRAGQLSRSFPKDKFNFKRL